MRSGGTRGKIKEFKELPINDGFGDSIIAKFSMAAAGCRQTSELTEPNRLCGAICMPFVSAVAAVFFAPDTLPRTDIHRFSVRHALQERSALYSGIV